MKHQLITGSKEESGESFESSLLCLEFSPPIIMQAVLWLWLLLIDKSERCEWASVPASNVWGRKSWGWNDWGRNVRQSAKSDTCLKYTSMFSSSCDYKLTNSFVVDNRERSFGRSSADIGWHPTKVGLRGKAELTDCGHPSVSLHKTAFQISGFTHVGMLWCCAQSKFKMCYRTTESKKCFPLFLSLADVLSIHLSLFPSVFLPFPRNLYFLP